MGKSSSAAVGYWYNVAFHAGLGIGPIDAFLEFRAGDKTAWSGNLTASGTISINALNLFGGEKDQGGIQGNVDVMFGDADQQPNTYLLKNFGSQVSAWRGLATLVFKGGKYGAMNPYPQKPSYKFCRILKGWDNGDCWYPDKAQVVLATYPIPADTQTWKYLVVDTTDTSNYSSASFDDSAWASGLAPFADRPWTPPQWTFRPSDYGFANAPNTYIPRAKSVWVRTTISLARGLPSVTFATFVDNNCDFYVNGVLAASVSTGSSGNFYHEISINPSLFQVGMNCIAAKFTDTGTATDPNNYAYFDLLLSTSLDLDAMNPAHILYYALTQQDMGREPVANMNDASFRTAADWYYAQAFGLCTEYDPSAESQDDFVARIETVAGCSVSRSPVDGQWYLDVSNGVYDLASLPVLTDDDILDFSDSPILLDSATNSVSVQYFDPMQNQNLTTAPVQAMAVVDAFGIIHAQTSYPEIPTNDLALRVAGRDLRAATTPTHPFSLTATRITYGWRVGTYFRLQSVKRGIADMVCILAEKSSGTLKSGAITITASQDIYSLPASSFVGAEPGVDTRPSQIPLAIILQEAFEAPYISVVAVLSRADMAVLPSDVGYLMAVAADPATSRDYTLMVSSGGDYAESTNGDWCATAIMVGASVYDDAAFTLAAGVQLADVGVGMAALWGSEIVRIDAIDVDAGTITLGRGCADTVPVRHAAGERIWFYATDAAADTIEYTDGETVDAKLLTNTGSQQLDLGAATPLPVVFESRVARPYPPGQLRINGDVAPSSVVGAVTVTGVHRDRVQQADQLVDSEMASVGPEAGTTYTVRYYLNDVLVNTDAALPAPSSTYTPSGAGVMRVEFESVREGLASYQMHVREFTLGQPLLDESGALITTEDDQTIIMG